MSAPTKSEQKILSRNFSEINTFAPRTNKSKLLSKLLLRTYFLIDTIESFAILLYSAAELMFSILWSEAGLAGPGMDPLYINDSLKSITL